MVKNFKQGLQTFKSIFTGMGITIRHFFGPTVTLQYPDERDVLPKRARSRLYVNIDDCIGCNLCARACPVNCIDIDTVKANPNEDLGMTSNGKQKRLWIAQFDIDMAKCMYCDLCVYPCPTECIYMVQEYEFSEFDRSNLLYKFSNLSAEKVAEVKESARVEAELAEKKKVEATVAKTEQTPESKVASVPGRVPGSGASRIPGGGGAARVPGSVPGGGGAARVPGSGAQLESLAEASAASGESSG
jgi:NADH-quinone oxidoreductase subunit I